jgi:hypothetical protein
MNFTRAFLIGIFVLLCNLSLLAYEIKITYFNGLRLYGGGNSLIHHAIISILFLIYLMISLADKTYSLITIKLIILSLAFASNFYILLENRFFLYPIESYFEVPSLLLTTFFSNLSFLLISILLIMQIVRLKKPSKEPNFQNKNE